MTDTPPTPPQALIDAVSQTRADNDALWPMLVEAAMDCFGESPQMRSLIKQLDASPDYRAAVFQGGVLEAFKEAGPNEVVSPWTLYRFALTLEHWGEESFESKVTWCAALVFSQQVAERVGQ